MPRVRVTRQLHFAAGHQLSNPGFTPEENRRVFGKCYNYHGHNYDLEVTVEGEVDAETGYVIDLGELKELVNEHVVSDLDHQNLNDGVTWMAGINPTAENLAIHIWRRLEERLGDLQLVAVKLWETPRNLAEYRGE